MNVALVLVAMLGWALAVVLWLVLAGERGHRYLLRAVLWRRRAPLGHRHHEVIGGLRSGTMSGFWMASCECGFNERAVSAGGAEGALRSHLGRARPWAHYAGAEPCAGASEHRVLNPDEAQYLVDSDATRDVEAPAGATVTEF